MPQNGERGQGGQRRPGSRPAASPPPRRTRFPFPVRPGAGCLLTAGPGTGCATGSPATSTGPGGGREGGEEGAREGDGAAWGSRPRFSGSPALAPLCPSCVTAGTAGAGAKPGAGLVLPRPRSHRVGAREASRRPHFDLLRVFSSIFLVLSGRGAPDSGVPRGRPAPQPPRLSRDPRGGRSGQGNKAVPRLQPQLRGRSPPESDISPAPQKSHRCFPEKSRPLRQRRLEANPEI